MPRPIKSLFKPSETQKQQVKKKASASTIQDLSSGKLSINCFELGLPKGEGKCKYGGQIIPAKHLKTGILLAIKRFKKRNLKNTLDSFINEIKIQLLVDSPHVVKLYGFFDDDEHFYLLTEFMEEGSLYTHIKINRNLEKN